MLLMCIKQTKIRQGRKKGRSCIHDPTHAHVGVSNPTIDIKEKAIESLLSASLLDNSEMVKGLSAPSLPYLPLFFFSTSIPLSPTS